MKNVQFSIKALAILKRKYDYSNFKFTVIGTGNYEKQLKKLAKKENLQDNVIFTGLIENKQELNVYYGKAHLMLFPSTFDTDGLVIAEAATQGTPTLTVKGYGSSERLTDGLNGFIANYDLNDFAEKIYEIANNNEIYKRVVQNLNTIEGETWLEVAKKYETLFNSTLK